MYFHRNAFITCLMKNNIIPTLSLTSVGPQFLYAPKPALKPGKIRNQMTNNESNTTEILCTGFIQASLSKIQGLFKDF